MPLFDELLMKVARQEPLAPVELENFRQEARALNDVKEFVKSFQGIDGKIASSFLNLPIDIIYSSVLEKDTASLTIPIPSIYKHLLIYGSGRTTGAGTGTENLLCRFNEDSAANYSVQKLTVANATVTGERNTSQTQTLIGGLAEGGRAAPDSTSFVAFLPYVNSQALFKTSFALVGPPMFLYFGNWTLNPPAGISSISFIPGANSIATGSVISLYGTK